MMGVPGLAKAATTISSVPAAHSPSAAQLHATARVDVFRHHSMLAMALNQTSTDRSTCKTRAMRKKSPPGSQALTPGVRAATSSSENRPEPISAIRPR